MRNILIATGLITVSLSFMSCGGAHGDNPGHAYMPDMYYSRAYETYGYNDVGGERDSLTQRHIFYNGLPVEGTIARGESMPTHMTAADTAGAKAVRSPLDTISGSPALMKEAERLYLVNCGICHGTALDGNGPLYNGGNGPYPAAPRDLKGAYSQALSDGSIFHTITFGKNLMGSYASQLTPEKRWWVIKYIRSKQTPAKATGSSTDSTANMSAAKDTTNKPKP